LKHATAIYTDILFERWKILLRRRNENEIYFYHWRSAFFFGKGFGCGIHFSIVGVSRTQGYQSKA